jgi:hypothetical protein
VESYVLLPRSGVKHVDLSAAQLKGPDHDSIGINQTIALEAFCKIG